MRLFGVVDGQINRQDRANWQSGGPWWGFDLAYGAPSLPVVLMGTFDAVRILNGTGDNALVLTGTYDAD